MREQRVPLALVKIDAVVQPYITSMYTAFEKISSFSLWASCSRPSYIILSLFGRCAVIPGTLILSPMIRMLLLSLFPLERCSGYGRYERIYVYSVAVLTVSCSFEASIANHNKAREMSQHSPGECSKCHFLISTSYFVVYTKIWEGFCEIFRSTTATVLPP